jgi:hypothetical protein
MLRFMPLVCSLGPLPDALYMTSAALPCTANLAVKRTRQNGNYNACAAAQEMQKDWATLGGALAFSKDIKGTHP